MSTLNSRTFNQVHWNWPSAVVTASRIVPICVSGEWPTYATEGVWASYSALGEWCGYSIAGEWCGYSAIGEWPTYGLDVDLEC